MFFLYFKYTIAFFSKLKILYLYKALVKYCVLS